MVKNVPLMLRYLAYIYLSMIVIAAVLIRRREESNDVRLSMLNSFSIGSL